MLEIDMGRFSRLILLSLICTALLGSSITVSDPFNASDTADLVGGNSNFDGQSVQVTIGGSTLTIDIRTNYDNPNLFSVRDTGVRLNPGDVFLTVNGTYQYGIPVAYHNGPAGGPWGERVLAGHVYSIDDPNALMTARQVLHDPMYIQYRPDSIVWMLDIGGVHDVTIGTPAVSVMPLLDGVNGPLYNIHIVTSLPSGLFSSSTDRYGLSFATTTGGNDIVQGTLNFSGFSAQAVGGTEVPEPSTWYLIIGAVLVGLAFLHHRKR